MSLFDKPVKPEGCIPVFSIVFDGHSLTKVTAGSNGKDIVFRIEDLSSTEIYLADDGDARAIGNSEGFTLWMYGKSGVEPQVLKTAMKFALKAFELTEHIAELESEFGQTIHDERLPGARSQRGVR